MNLILQLLSVIFFGLDVHSQISISNVSDLQSTITNTPGSLDIELSGDYSLSTGILVSGNTELNVSSPLGAQITCVNETFAFDVSPGSTLDIQGISINNCFGSAIRTDSSVLTVNNCTFENNTNASFGGAIYSLNSDVTVENSVFSRNSADQGGSVYLNSDKIRRASFDNCRFLYNSANEVFSTEYQITFPFFTGGGAVSVENIDVSITRSTFTGNNATQSGGAIVISDNSSLSVSECTFDSNMAVKFGAGVTGPNMVIKNSIFTNNTCDQDGGGIYTWGTSDIDSILCENNVAIDKGGCLYARGDIAVGANTTMIGNTGYFGGSIYTAYGSDVKVYGGYYANSTANRNGGFMYISDGGRAEIYNGIVEHCSAVRRAAIVYVSGTSDDMGLGGGRLHIHDGLYRYNSVGELGGGFVVWGKSTSFIISGGIYSDNYSPYAGGLLFLEQFAIFEASDCLFENNLSDDQGGAIYARDPSYISVSCTSINNQSPHAAYIYITHSVETSYITNSIIIQNSSGSSDVIYVANSDVVIDNVYMEHLDEDTQTICINQDKGSDVIISNSTFRGWHGESIITSLNPSDNTTRIIECDFADTFSSTPVVSQSRVLVVNAFVNNNTIFSSDTPGLLSNSFKCEDYEICDGCIDNELGVLCTCSSVQCHTGSEISVSVTQEPDRTFYYPDVIDFYMSVTNDDNNCVIWTLEEYSITSSSDTTPSSGIVKPGESVLVYVKIFPGIGTDTTFFTFTGPLITESTVIPISHTWFRCGTFEIEVVADDDVFSCVPCANYIEQTEDEVGYDCTGDGITVENLPIKPGFWRSSSVSLEILKCNVEYACIGGSNIEDSDSYCDTGHMGPYCQVCVDGYRKGVNEQCIKCGKDKAGLISIGIIIVILSLLLSCLVFLFLIDRLSILTRVSTCSKKGKSTNRGISMILKTVRDNSHRLKILIVVWQILVVFPEIVNVTYPDKYSSFLQWIKTCMTFFSFNLDFLSFSCIFPYLDHYGKLLMTTIFPIVLLFILLGTYHLSIKINDGSSDSLRDTWARHVSVGLVITFLIFTSTSTVIFKTFVCDMDVLPGRGFLRSDYGLECFTPTHILYRIYAGIMIIVYPMGIPFLYFVLLYRNKDDLLVEDNDCRKQNHNVAPYRFLWKDFRPNVYFFEVLECMRRILLTGLLVFIKPGSSIQVTVACLFAFISLSVFEVIRPHYNKTDTWLYRLGCIIVFISSYMGLLLKVDYESQQYVLEFILIFLNVVLAVAIIGSIILSVYTHDHDIVDISTLFVTQKKDGSLSSIHQTE